MFKWFMWFRSRWLRQAQWHNSATNFLFLQKTTISHHKSLLDYWDLNLLKSDMYWHEITNKQPCCPCKFHFDQENFVFHQALPNANKPYTMTPLGDLMNVSQLAWFDGHSGNCDELLALVWELRDVCTAEKWILDPEYWIIPVLSLFLCSHQKALRQSTLSKNY